MIKGLIAPLQKILLQKKLCPACTRPLTKAKIMESRIDTDILVCECGRIFVFERELDNYRRAVQEDLTLFRKNRLEK